MRKNPNLDLMRSVAVMLVISGHVLYYTGGASFGKPFGWFAGMLGVYLFFTHTTLVLMWSLERDPHTLRFYLRRAFRLYPLWIVVLILSVAVKLPTSPAYPQHFEFFKPGALEFLDNALLVMNLTDYGVRVIGASWSLPIEVQMYVVLPFLFFFIRSNRNLFALFLLEALAIMTARAIDGRMAGDLLFCAPAFIPGAIAYQIYRRKLTPRLPGWAFPVWLGLLIVSFDYHAGLQRDSFRTGWIFALLVGCSLPFFRLIGTPAVKRAAHWIAKYSYGFYLCHFAAIAVAIHYMAGMPMVLRVAAFFAVLIGLSVGLYHAVEEPMIGLGSRLAERVGRGREPSVDLNLEVAP